jgi:uncharacterized protein (TIGR02996 family)
MATGEVLQALEAAREALSDSPSAVLHHLLDAWRIVRAPPIADVIDVASKVCRVGQESLVGTLEAHRSEWKRVATLQDPADLERLVESLPLRESEKSAERVLLLQKWPPNPHMTQAFTEHLRDVSYHGTTDGGLFWRRVQELHLAIQDTRIPTRFSPPGLDSFRFTTPRKQWPTPRALTDEEKSVLEEIKTRLSTRAVTAKNAEQDGKKLLDNVFAAPDDDAPRIVYADWLLEQKDPRGEFITLQMERAQGKKVARANATRERELLSKHWRDWLGESIEWLNAKSFTFERGFLATAIIGKWAGAFDQKEWSTCRKLTISPQVASAGGVFYALVGSAHLNGLKDLNVSAEVLERLATKGRAAPDKEFDPQSVVKLQRQLERIQSRGRHLPHHLMESFPFPALREFEYSSEGLPHPMFGGLSSNQVATKLQFFRYTDTASGASYQLERNANGELKQFRVLKDEATEHAVRRHVIAATMCKALDFSFVE